MSFISSVFIFIFCLSINLCSGRNLGILFHKGSPTQTPFSSKGSFEEAKGIVDGLVAGAISEKENESVMRKGGVSGVKSLVVSWVQKHEGNADFFSDYSRPTTRPPSHN